MGKELVRLRIFEFLLNLQWYQDASFRAENELPGLFGKLALGLCLT